LPRANGPAADLRGRFVADLLPIALSFTENIGCSFGNRVIKNPAGLYWGF
jgi:hypothetical protein